MARQKFQVYLDEDVADLVRRVAESMNVSQNVVITMALGQVLRGHGAQISTLYAAQLVDSKDAS